MSRPKVSPEQDRPTAASLWLSTALKRSGLTQKELAKRAGINRSQLNRIINGKADCLVETLVTAIEVCGYENLELVAKKQHGDCEPT